MDNAIAAAQPQPHSKGRMIAYWLVTALIVFELVYGALWDFNALNKGYVYGVLQHLGYPQYLAAMLGVSKLAAATVILLPRFRVLKEWAYAGVVILFGGGFASHLAVGDGVEIFIWSLLFALIAVASWALRPRSRKLP